ncbi:hypothetical protein Nmel_012342 [Mimus melanotis]
MVRGEGIVGKLGMVMGNGNEEARLKCPCRREAPVSTRLVSVTAHRRQDRSRGGCSSPAAPTTVLRQPCAAARRYKDQTEATGTAISAGPEFLTHKLHLCPSEYPPDCHARPLHPYYQYSMMNKDSSIVCNVLSCASTTC